MSEGQRGRTWVKSRVSEQAWQRAFRSDAASAQGGLCRYCRVPLSAQNISADHLKPRRSGGTTQRENIKAACRDCNFVKGSLSEKVFISAIKAPQPGSPLHVWLIFMRRRIWVRTHRACDRIEAMVS